MATCLVCREETVESILQRGAIYRKQIPNVANLVSDLVLVAMSENRKENEPLLLPAPSSTDGEPTQLDVNSGVSIKLDALGPMVVNSDGTLSRISNWTEMSEIERDRTLRVLVARNKVRLSNEEKKLAASNDQQSTSTEPESK